MSSMTKLCPRFPLQCKIKPDIVMVEEDAPKPTYDLIIGIKSLAKMGAIRNINSRSITIDQVTLEMREIAKIDIKQIRAQFWELLETDSCRGATKILDATYEKADLPKVVSKNCSHLSLHERHELLYVVK